jgi:hypothetical protein
MRYRRFNPKFFPTRWVLGKRCFCNNPGRKISRRLSQVNCTATYCKEEFFNMVGYQDIFKGRMNRFIKIDTKFMVKRCEPILMYPKRYCSKPRREDILEADKIKHMKCNNICAHVAGCIDTEFVRFGCYMEEDKKFGIILQAKIVKNFTYSKIKIGMNYYVI